MSLSMTGCAACSLGNKGSPDRLLHLGSQPGEHTMRVILVAMIASVLSILAFKYADHSLGNVQIVATAQELASS